MTVFNSGDSNQGDQKTEESKENTNQGSFVAKLVESRGEQWKDPEVIAKGKLESDEHIANLERQLQEMREDLGEQEHSKKLLDLLQTKAGDSANPKPEETNNNKNSSTNDGDTKPNVSEDDLKSLVENVLTGREKKNTQDQNLAIVNSQLEELYGTEAEAEIIKKAQELGLTKDRLQEMAAESPTAFMKLIGEEPKDKQGGAFNSSSINTEGARTTSNSGVRDYAYYKNLRKTNKTLYYSPSTQNQMLQDRMKLGAAFGN